jgi:fucose 4-O-acetylase-like acetyltransferase
MSLDTRAAHSGTTGQATAAPPRPAGAVERDAHFDNAKFVAILLVGVGHAIGPLWELRAAGALNLVIYGFHMPAFVMMAGYFSKNFDFSKRRVQRLVAGLVVPYLAFEIIYTALKKFTDGPHVEWSLLSPVWLNWFLAALFVWRLISPLWRNIRWPFAIAVAVCLAANLSTFPDTFSMTRVLMMLPFFVAGMLLKPEHFAVLARTWIRVLAVVVLVIAFAGAYVIRPFVSTKLLYWADTATDLHTPYLEATALRIALLAGSFVLMTAFFALVPRRRMWFTSLGAGTIYAYLLHGIPDRLAEHYGLFDHLVSPWGFAVVTIVSGTLMIALMTKPVRLATSWLVEPQLNWIFRTDPFGRARHRGAHRASHRPPVRAIEAAPAASTPPPPRNEYAPRDGTDLRRAPGPAGP